MKKQKLQRNKPWFNRVRDNMDLLPDALAFYESIADEGFEHTNLQGRISDLKMETPGLVHYYGSIYEDCASIRKWMEENLKTLEAEKYKWMMTSTDAKAKYGELKTTEAAKFVKADNEIVDYTYLIRVVAGTENQLGALMDGLKQRGIVLNNLTVIYKEGLEEKWIDSTKEN